MPLSRSFQKAFEEFEATIPTLVQESIREREEAELIERELSALDDGLTLNQLSPETIEYLADIEGWYDDDE